MQHTNIICLQPSTQPTLPLDSLSGNVSCFKWKERREKFQAFFFFFFLWSWSPSKDFLLLKQNIIKDRMPWGLLFLSFFFKLWRKSRASGDGREATLHAWLHVGSERRLSPPSHLTLPLASTHCKEEGGVQGQRGRPQDSSMDP